MTKYCLCNYRHLNISLIHRRGKITYSVSMKTALIMPVCLLEIQYYKDDRKPETSQHLMLSSQSIDSVF